MATFLSDIDLPIIYSLLWITVGLSLLNQPPSTATTPEIWHERASKCYLIVSLNMTWAAAKDECLQRGATLLELYSAAELYYLQRWLPSDTDDNYWTAHAIAPESNWSSAAIPIPPGVWSDTEPNYTGPCARLKPNRTDGLPYLYDHPCDLLYKGLCQKLPGSNNYTINSAILHKLPADDQLCLMAKNTVRSLTECSLACSTSGLCVHIRYDQGAHSCSHFQDKGTSLCQTPSNQGTFIDYVISRLC